MALHRVAKTHIQSLPAHSRRFRRCLNDPILGFRLRLSFLPPDDVRFQTATSPPSWSLPSSLSLSLSLFSLTDTLITVNQRSRCSPSELACSKSPFQVVERLQQQQQQQADTVSDEQKAHCHWQGTLDGCMQDAGQRKEKESERASERAKEEAKRWWPTKASPKWQIV